MLLILTASWFQPFFKLKYLSVSPWCCLENLLCCVTQIKYLLRNTIECFYCLHKMHVEYINIIKAELFASSIWSCFRFDTGFYICVDVFFFLCLIHFSPECFSASIPPLETTEGPGASDR